MASKSDTAQGISFREKIQPVRACMRLWYVMVMGSRNNVPTPQDLPRFRTQRKAWRVLILGNGPTHGWGVDSHDQSLIGQLARAMASVRGKPVDVDYIGDELMNAQTASNWLKSAPLHQYDQVIVAVGWNDAVRATPDHIWEQAMTDLLDDIHNRRSAAARVIMIGIEPIGASSGYGGLPGKIAQRTADRFNVFIQHLAQRNEDEYVPLAARDQSNRMGSAETYRIWAEAISEVAAPLLPGHEPGRRIFNDDPSFKWVGTRRALGLDGTDTPVLLGKIAQQAKEHFKVYTAQINLMDGDRQWIPNHKGVVPSSVPRELTYCDVTTQQPNGRLTVPNGKRDPRFKDNPYLDQAHMPFYAGQALKSRSGEVIGTFCLMDVAPRPKFTIDEAKFQEFAATAQAALWEIEDAAIAAQTIDEGAMVS